MSFHRATGLGDPGLVFSGDYSLWPQDRLALALCARPHFDARTRSLLAVTVLAFSAGGVTTSVASEPDQGLEGQAPPDQVGVISPEPPAPPSDPLATPPDDGAQAGGSESETVLPDATDPAPPNVTPAPGADEQGGGEQSDDGSSGADAAPLEAEPVDDPYGRLVLGDPEAPATPVTTAPPPVSEAPPQGAPPAPPSPQPLPPVAPDADPQAGAEQRDVETRPDRQASARHRKKGTRHGRSEMPQPGKRHERSDKLGSKRATEQAEQPAVAVSPPTDYSAQPQEAAQPQQAAAPPTRAHPPNARFHLVRRGESLWSIATALLGPGATPAEVTREVQRLWRLNEERIGTGDPSLLPIGVKLRLR